MTCFLIYTHSPNNANTDMDASASTNNRANSKTSTKPIVNS